MLQCNENTQYTQPLLMDIRHVSKGRFTSTIVWAIIISASIVALTAGLGRAALNLKGALVNKPDLALYLLLPEEEITTSEILRETADERAYLAETKDGPKLIKLRRGIREWYVAEIEQLRGDE